MNQKSIEQANDPDLALSVKAIERAAKQAAKLARSTGTELVIFRNGQCVRVKPDESVKTP